MFPKTGKTFPNRDLSRRPPVDYAGGIAKALRRELGGTHRATKTVMKWTGADERTVRNWLAGATGPSGEHLILLMRYSDEVLETMLQISERKGLLATLKLVQVRDRLSRDLPVVLAMLAELPPESKNS
jgi:hypothetical protein